MKIHALVPPLSPDRSAGPLAAAHLAIPREPAEFCGPAARGLNRGGHRRDPALNGRGTLAGRADLAAVHPGRHARHAVSLDRKQGHREVVRAPLAANGDVKTKLLLGPQKQVFGVGERASGQVA
jgi:hypothetical protein